MSIRRMDKEVVVHIHNGMLLSYKKMNAFESVLMRWMELEPIIQSDINQKEKHQYSILMYIYRIYKHGNNDPICEAAKETQI